LSNTQKRNLLLLVVISIFTVGMVNAAYDTVQVTFYLNALPVCNNVDFVDSAYALTSSLTPDDSEIFGVNFTVTTSGTLADIRNCTIYVFDDSVHGSNYDTASPDGIFLIVGVWNESDDLWTLDQGAMSQWTLQSPVDCGSASALTSFEFTFRFDISTVARADTDWNATVIIYDDDTPTAESASAAETVLVTMSNNFALTFSLASVTYGEIAPLTVNNTHNALTFTVLANNNWEILINATDFNTTGGPSDVDIEANNILCWDNDGVTGGTSLWVRNTIQTALGTWDAQAPMNDESGLSRTVHLFLSTGSHFTLGYTWNAWFYSYIQLDT